MLSICRNREDCHFGDHKTLRELNRETGTKVGQGMVSTYLELLNATTNYKVKLSRLQIKMLSQTIYDKFFYLKDTELMLFFSDYYKYVNSDDFYGSIEPKTITTMLTKWVRKTRGAAIERHENRLHKERLESSKSECVNWEQYSAQKGVDPSNSPVGRIIAGLGSKTDKEVSESIKKSAEELVNNRWGYNQRELEIARKSFMTRYGSTPEYYLKKHDEYATAK